MHLMATVRLKPTGPHEATEPNARHSPGGDLAEEGISAHDASLCVAPELARHGRDVSAVPREELAKLGFVRTR